MEKAHTTLKELCREVEQRSGTVAGGDEKLPELMRMVHYKEMIRRRDHPRDKTLDRQALDSRT